MTHEAPFFSISPKRLGTVSNRREFQAGSDSSSTWHFTYNATLGLLSFLLIFVFSAGIEPCCAHAATWPVPASELSASVGFHETYTAGDNSYAHSGIDIPASAGMQISTPAAGTVSFTGAIPSGDSRISGTPSQETMRAVSIKLANGKTVTLMPFASVDVKRGSRVFEGQRLGTLAATGDISSSEPHLHMGLKEGRTYYDPMSLFGMSSVAPVEPAVKKRESSERAASQPKAQLQVAIQPEVASVPASEAGAATQSAPQAQSQLERKKSGNGATEGAREKAKERTRTHAPQTEWQPGNVSSGDVAWQPDAEATQLDLLVTLASTVDPLVQACTQQAASLIAGLQTLSQGTGIPEWVVYLVALALGLVLLTASIWAGVRWGLPVVGSLWRKASNVWNGGNKRGKLLGLFPAPGSAFITRGR